MRISIIRTGTANLASVVAAFKRLALPTRIVNRPDELATSDAVVLPGVGSFGAGMSALNDAGWSDLLFQRFVNDLPTLSICLGTQLLCQASEERLGVDGLGLLPTTVRRLPDTVRVPHFGWNQIASKISGLPSGYAYFANSFCVADIEAVQSAGWQTATTEYAIPFVAAAQRGNWLACQFHPELSGDWGMDILQNWIASITASAGQNVLDKERPAC